MAQGEWDQLEKVLEGMAGEKAGRLDFARLPDGVLALGFFRCAGEVGTVSLLDTPQVHGAISEVIPAGKLVDVPVRL